LTWQLLEGDPLLSIGRRYQFDYESASSAREAFSAQLSKSLPRVQKSTQWELPPHAAYFLPLVVAGGLISVNPTAYALYCDVLLLLTAMDGGEAILDRLAEAGVGLVPFEDRWSWRSRIHLPLEAWQQVERALRWSEAPCQDTAEIQSRLAQALVPWTTKALTLEDFAFERVDLRLETTSDAEIVRTVRPPDSTDGNLPDTLLLAPEALRDKLVVRIGQVSMGPKRDNIMARFPGMDPVVSNHVMEQVAAAFQSRNYGGHDHDPDLVLLPEVSIPQPEVQTVRDLVAHTGRASLAGLYWRVLPSVYPASRLTSPVRRWFVNEAELVIPVDHKDRGPNSTRWYRVRKPVPAHFETGLAQALTTNSLTGTSWRILKGHRWYRFVHPRWGDFTIAICSDLLDAAPWRSLRGELLHLFMVAFNKDVDLYDSLTWVRAYENYVNLVAVNHGSFGGSFLWTPRRNHGRELARLRGGRLFLLADVDIPVKELLEQQLSGVKDAIDDAANWWGTGKHDSSKFKSPPPGFIRRAFKAEET